MENETQGDVLAHERALWTDGCTHVAGVDEAGRGCLAGPVVAAAVILPEGCFIEGLDDSKKLSERTRDRLKVQIKEEAMAFGIGRCTPAEIDDLNILHAAMEAMRRAVQQLAPAPDYVLIDGNRCPETLPAPAKALVKGDQRSHAIAAASVLAKTSRDATMRALHDAHPHFGWDTNVGYPTAAHYDALAEHGSTLHHRQSFRLEKR